VTERFLKSADKAHNCSQGCYRSSGCVQWALKDPTSEGALRFPALYAMQVAFKPIAYAQTVLEASENPTLHLVVPMLEHIQSKLAELIEVGSDVLQQFAGVVHL